MTYCANYIHFKVCEHTKTHKFFSLGWLEPLLNAVYKNKSTASCPIIDMINSQDLRYSKLASLAIGVFTWDVTFNWVFDEGNIERERRSKSKYGNAEPYR